MKLIEDVSVTFNITLHNILSHVSCMTLTAAFALIYYVNIDILCLVTRDIVEMA